jgi:beta-lactamase regulating signal transducer with metallopeptidase domain
MGGCFYIVLNMSITASLIGIAVLAVRAVLGRRLPAGARYALWGLAGLRLALPFSLPSKASLLNLVGQYVLHAASVPAGGSGTTLVNSIRAANASLPIRFKTETFGSIFDAAGWVWLAGALLMAAALILMYASAAKRFARAMPFDDGGLLAECAARTRARRLPGIFLSDAVASPAVFGVFRPRILVPPAAARDREALRYALLHELAHVRRGDNALRMLSYVLLCLHWFNPFAWLFFSFAGRDMESACDASALKRLSAPERKGYALALASLASTRQPPLAAAFGSSETRRRIVSITKYRKVTLAAGIFTFLCMLALFVVLMTNPAG